MPVLAVRSPEKRLFRIGRRPDAWAAPDWSRAGADQTFGNRFDDPKGEYRVLYAATQRIGCFIECLACFRPDLEVLAALRKIDGPAESFGFHPEGWVAKRAMGSARVGGRFADIYSSAWISLLRGKLAAQAVALGVSEIDGAALQSARPRQLTQCASRIVYSRGLNGVRYASRFGNELENWALFEPWDIQDPKSVMIAASDPDLGEAIQRLGIRPAMA